MRLDHLLSTEFFRTPVRRPSCGPRAGDGSRVWRGRAGVEEIVGFAGPWGLAGSGADMLLGSRTATRDLVACGFPDAPGGTPSACGPRVGSGRGAWWFENWIVDASNAMM